MLTSGTCARCGCRASLCLPGPYLMGLGGSRSPAGGRQPLTPRPAPFRPPLPALPGEGAPGRADRLAPAGSRCPVSPRPEIRARLKAALFRQQKDISVAPWEPGRGLALAEEAPARPRHRRGNPSPVPAAAGGLGTHLPRASQAPGPAGGVPFPSPGLALPAAAVSTAQPRVAGSRPPASPGGQAGGGDVAGRPGTAHGHPPAPGPDLTTQACLPALPPLCPLPAVPPSPAH